MNTLSMKSYRITDMNTFDSGKCNNGGQYWYEITYTKEGGKYKLRYRTSAEFDYCEVRGGFTDCGAKCNSWHEGKCQEPLQYVSQKEMEKILVEAKGKGFCIERI